jgi:hypothetical protein
MLPRCLSGEAGRCEKLAGAQKRRRRASRNVVAEEGQGVDGDRTTDRDEGGTNSGCLLAKRRASIILMMGGCMHLRSAKLKPMGLLHGNSLGCLLGCHCCELRVGWCWWSKRGRRDGLSSMLFEFPSTDVDDAHRTLVEATSYAGGGQSYDMYFHHRATSSYLCTCTCTMVL